MLQYLPSDVSPNEQRFVSTM